jgi:hypothetical protein
MKLDIIVDATSADAPPPYTYIVLDIIIQLQDVCQMTKALHLTLNVY